LETLRDRRTIIVAILLPIVMTPVLTVGIPLLAHRQQLQLQDAPVPVVIRGGAFAPELVAFGRNRDFIRPVVLANPNDALARHQIDAIVDIPPSFGKELRAGRAAITVVYDESNVASRIAQRRIQELIAAYSVRLTEGKLRGRGLELQDLTPIDVVAKNIADDRRFGGALLAGLLPFLISLWAVLGGQNTALDVGVGERERLTLDSLLVAPAPRWTLGIGKFLAVSATAMFSVVVVVATTLISLRLGAGTGVPELARSSVALSGSIAAGILLIALVQVAFLSSVLLALSLLARGLREAQQYFTPLYLFLVFPAMLASFLEEWERSPWAYMIPALNAAFAFRGVLLGTLVRSSLIVTVATQIAGMAIGLWAIIRLLERGTQASRL
jgi:sodium transport system permease protein